MRLAEDLSDEVERVSRLIIDVAIFFEKLNQGLSLSQIAIAAALTLPLTLNCVPLLVTNAGIKIKRVSQAVEPLNLLDTIVVCKQEFHLAQDLQFAFVGQCLFGIPPLVHEESLVVLRHSGEVYLLVFAIRVVLVARLR